MAYLWLRNWWSLPPYNQERRYRCYCSVDDKISIQFLIYIRWLPSIHMGISMTNHGINIAEIKRFRFSPASTLFMYSWDELLTIAKIEPCFAKPLCWPDGISSTPPTTCSRGVKQPSAVLWFWQILKQYQKSCASQCVVAKYQKKRVGNPGDKRDDWSQCWIYNRGYPTSSPLPPPKKVREWMSTYTDNFCHWCIHSL